MDSVHFAVAFVMFSFFMLSELGIQEAGAGPGMH